MISNENKIEQYLHCDLCIKEWLQLEQPKCSPKDYARIQAGFTPEGLQVWCNRHECNVVHIDFEGARHPANITRKAEDVVLGGIEP